MAGEILSVKPVEPPPPCVRKSTRSCYVATCEGEGWKQPTCLCSTACAECVRGSTRNLFQRDAGLTHDGSTSRLEVGGACEDSDAVADAETAESVKKTCFGVVALGGD